VRWMDRGGLLSVSNVKLVVYLGQCGGEHSQCHAIYIERTCLVSQILSF
jgi:hypothetical protein